MADRETALAVAAARRWSRMLGYGAAISDDAVIVVDPAYPDVWDGNFALPQPGGDPHRLIDQLDNAMTHSQWRIVMTDAATDPTVDAVLAQNGFAQHAAAIEMISHRPIMSPPDSPAVRFHTVDADADWHRLLALVRTDHDEGRRTGAISATVRDGLIAGMRRDCPPGRYTLMSLDGADIGYGFTLVCPDRLGLIDELFTIPAARGRGAMSAFIAAASEGLIAEGCGAVFLDAHAHDTPRLLYQRLGFRPISLSRRWVKQVAPVS